MTPFHWPPGFPTRFLPDFVPLLGSEEGILPGLHMSYLGIVREKLRPTPVLYFLFFKTCKILKGACGVLGAAPSYSKA